MDISTTAATASINPLEAETEVPTRTLPSKPLSFTNGVLKRHHLNGPPVVVTYKECLKNHAASLGRHAVDGCGEFMPSPTANPLDPTSLKCAACGCHRNFHRRDPEEPLPLSNNTAQHVIEYRPHHRHHPPPPHQRGGHSSPNSASPPPISSSYYPSAPHMLLALSSGLSGPLPENNTAMTSAAGTTAVTAANPNGRKRFRTKFTQAQKERMLEFAGRVGWKMQKRDEELITEFCSEVGVDKGVFKVWMHNNKNTFGKRDTNNDNINHNNGIGVSNGSINSLENTPTNNHHHHHHHDNNHNHHENLSHHHQDNDNSVSADAVATNGSSSSS